MDVACGIRRPCAGPSGRPARRLWRRMQCLEKMLPPHGRLPRQAGDRLPEPDLRLHRARLQRTGKSLVTFYNALDGPNWEDSGQLAERRSVGRMGWSHNRRQRPRDLVADGGDRDWTGVERGDSPRAGRPRSLGNTEYLAGGFHGVDLRGEIPPELATFPNLEYDCPSMASGFTGEIPPELGNLSNLTNLWIEGNGLTGEIPPELGNCGQPVNDLNLRW